jgi:hypothetical protein
MKEKRENQTTQPKVKTEKPTEHLQEIKFPKQFVSKNFDNVYKNFEKNSTIPSRGLNSHIEFAPTDKNDYMVVHGNVIQIFNDENEPIHEYSRFGGNQHTANFRSGFLNFFLIF